MIDLSKIEPDYILQITGASNFSKLYKLKNNSQSSEICGVVADSQDDSVTGFFNGQETFDSLEFTIIPLHARHKDVHDYKFKLWGHDIHIGEEIEGRYSQQVTGLSPGNRQFHDHNKCTIRAFKQHFAKV